MKLELYSIITLFSQHIRFVYMEIRVDMSYTPYGYGIPSFLTIPHRCDSVVATTAICTKKHRTTTKTKPTSKLKLRKGQNKNIQCAGKKSEMQKQEQHLKRPCNLQLCDFAIFSTFFLPSIR